jgi:endonuclease YncB( thermonuclease family)
MSIFLTNWHKAERLRYKTYPNALWQRAWRKPRLTSRVRRWWRATRLLGWAAIAGLAWALVIDHFEREPAKQSYFAATTQTEVLRGTSRERSASRPAAPTQREAVRSGRAAVTVIDGDTLQIGNERMRLHGIDAPESQQRCVDGWQAGQAATRALSGLVSGGAPSCERITTDRYGRTVAICRVNGQDIGAAMVRSGQAWAYIKYSSQYMGEERLAKAERLGVHARACMQPADFRAQKGR